MNLEVRRKERKEDSALSDRIDFVGRNLKINILSLSPKSALT